MEFEKKNIFLSIKDIEYRYTPKKYNIVDITSQELVKNDSKLNDS